MGRILTPPCTPIATRISGDGDSDSSKRNWVSLLEAINVFFIKLRKQTSRGVSSATKKIQSNNHNHNNNSDHSPRSPLAKPKQLFVNLSNKAIHFRHKSNNKPKSVSRGIEGELDFGDGGLWQRNILMGDKCQPLDFSGVIYYDNNGKQLPEFPMKSPRASPLPSYMYASSEKY